MPDDVRIIDISLFKGMAPRVHARNLPPEYAQVSTNTDLSQGMLKPFYKPSATKTLDATATKSIYPVKTTSATFWLCSQYEAHFVNVPVYNSAGRFVYTDGVRGKESNYALASDSGAETFGAPDTTYYLGVPKPSSALTVTVMGTGDGEVVDSVSYVYTFVTEWGYEGEPSDPTDVYDIEGGEYVKLTAFEIPVPTGYNIVGIRLYRTSTGSNEADYQFVSEAMTGASADYITPAEITAAGDLWYDQDAVDSELTDALDLGEVIACENYTEPPATLKGLLALPNGCVVGYRDKEVYLSEPFIHYGFPDASCVTTHFDVVALGNYGTTVIVGTEGNPYAINGYDPQAVSMVRLPDQQSCLYSRGMVSGSGFVLYPSPDGLYRIGEEGNGLATAGIFTKKQWRDLLTTTSSYDKTVIGFLYDDKYYGFFEGTANGFIVDFTQNYYVTFSLPSGYLVYGGHLDIESDTLYLLVKIGSTYYIKAWEGDTTDNLVLVWKSKIYVTNYEFYSCAKVNGAPVADSTGTGTITTTGTAVEGVGTAFTTQLEAGNVIYNATLNEYREISSITDNDTLTLVSAFSSNVSAEAFKYNSATMNVYKDSTLFFTRALNSTEPFRLPSGKGREWEVEIKADKQMYRITLARTMGEL